MDLQFIEQSVSALLQSSPQNFVKEEESLRPDLIGLQMFEAAPLFCAASAADPMFAELQKPGVIGPAYPLPTEWLPEAKSVISFFLPFTERVRTANRKAPRDVISDEWYHGRVEGQIMMDEVGAYICSLLEQAGHKAVYPAASENFRMIEPFFPNWSERHTAFVCGLGTFGMSKGLITKKGTAGRYGSIITSAVLTPTPREYSDPFEYCSRCGVCQRLCPADAIDPSRGIADAKDNPACGAFNKSKIMPPQKPGQRKHYGCGKCQVGVPCETGIPPRKSTP